MKIYGKEVAAPKYKEDSLFQHLTPKWRTICFIHDFEFLDHSLLNNPAAGYGCAGTTCTLLTPWLVTHLEKQ